MGVDSNPFPQNIECDIIDIFPCVQATSGITKATRMAVALFNRLVDMGVLNFPYFSDPSLDAVCRWHLSDLHTTKKCVDFKDFLNKHRDYSWYDLSNQEVALGLGYLGGPSSATKLSRHNPLTQGSASYERYNLWQK